MRRTDIMGAAVVGSLHAAVEMTKASQSMAPLVVLDVVEAERLLERIAETCPDHQACEACEARFCRTCQIEGPSDCDHGRILCLDCAVSCPKCAREVEPDYDPEADPCWGNR